MTVELVIWSQLSVGGYETFTGIFITDSTTTAVALEMLIELREHVASSLDITCFVSAEMFSSSREDSENQASAQ